MNKKSSWQYLILGLIVAGIIVLGGTTVKDYFGTALFSVAKEINEEKSFSTEAAAEIEIDLSSTSLHIITTQGSEVRFHLYGKSRHDTNLSAEMNNGRITAQLKRRKSIISFGENLKMDVYIPEGYDKDLSIDTSSGNIKIDSLILADIKLNTSSGELDADMLTAERLIITTSSGDLNIRRINAEKLNVKGTSSKINITECMARDADIVATSGNVKINNCGGSMDLKTTSASVEIGFNEFENKNVNIGSTSGNVTLELPHNAEFNYYVSTLSGRLQSDFFDDFISKRAEGQVGAKDNELTLHTTSGNIEILKK